MLPAATRISIAFVVSLAAWGLAWIARDRFIPPLQRSRETPRGWVDLGWPTWALLTGTSLGIGAITRIGFWAWYVVPAASLLWGSVALASTVYAAYGLSRAAGSLWIHVRKQPARSVIMFQPTAGFHLMFALLAFSTFSTVLLA